MQLDWFVAQKLALDNNVNWRSKQSRAPHRNRRAAFRYCGIDRIWVHRGLALSFISTGVLSIGACACYASPRSTHSIARIFARRTMVRHASGSETISQSDHLAKFRSAANLLMSVQCNCTASHHENWSFVWAKTRGDERIKHTFLIYIIRSTHMLHTLHEWKAA